MTTFTPPPPKVGKFNYCIMLFRGLGPKVLGNEFGERGGGGWGWGGGGGGREWEQTDCFLEIHFTNYLDDVKKLQM